MGSDFDIEKLLSEIDDDESSHDNIEHEEDLDDSISGEEGTEGSILDQYRDIESEESEKNTIDDATHYNDSDTETVKRDVEVRGNEAQETIVYGNFSIKGTKSWNIKEPYLISIDADKIGSAIDQLKNSFYFIEGPTEDPRVKSDIKMHLAKFIRNPELNIHDRYQEFIIKLIVTESEKIATYFKIEPDKKYLFLYHLGPLNMFYILNELFKYSKFGYCYFYDKQSRNTTRYLPVEYIKERILTWYEENINILDLPFNNLQILEGMVKSVYDKYNDEKKKFSIKLDRLNSKLEKGKRITGSELLEIKGVQWFGLPNIITYKRFITRTIFK